MSGPISNHIRSHVWGVAACFIAIMGTAVVASASGGPEATRSAKSPTKQVKKLKRKLASVEQRLAALEGKPAAASLPPSGPAGGDLTGGYPNPLIGPNAVGTAEVDGTLTGADISDTGGGTVGAADIGNNVVGSSELADVLTADVLSLFPAGSLYFGENATPAPPVANVALIYARDSGGLTQVVAHFNDGEIDVLAQEAP